MQQLDPVGIQSAVNDAVRIERYFVTKFRGQTHDGVEAIATIGGTVARYADIEQMWFQSRGHVDPPISIVGRVLIIQFALFRGGEFEDIDSVEHARTRAKCRPGEIERVMERIVVDRAGEGRGIEAQIVRAGIVDLGAEFPAVRGVGLIAKGGVGPRGVGEKQEE